MQRRGRAQSFRCLEKLEQTLADRKETNGGAGKKYGTNERLISQRRERASLEIAEFGDQLIECLPFRVAFLSDTPKPSIKVDLNLGEWISRRYVESDDRHIAGIM